MVRPLSLSLVLLAGMVLASSCAAPGTTAHGRPYDPVLRASAIAARQFGAAGRWSLNVDSTAVLCVQEHKPTRDVPQRAVDLAIADLGSDSVLFTYAVVDGEAAWHTPRIVRVVQHPGMTRDNDTTATNDVFYYDIITRSIVAAPAADSLITH